MSDEFDPEDYEGVSEKMATVPRRQVRVWEKQAKQLAETQGLLSQLQKERSFVRAGIPEDGLGKLFMKGYDGPDDVDAIKAAALEYGIIKPTQEQQAQINQSLAGHQAASEMASGAAPANSQPDIGARLNAAKSAAEVAQIMHEAGIKPSDLENFPDLRR